MGTALAERESELRSVSATINYTRPIAQRLHIDVRDFSRTNMQFEPHTMKICDARGLQERLSLDREGFVLASHKSAVAADESEATTTLFFAGDAAFLCTTWTVCPVTSMILLPASNKPR